jgi:hypothetical protein
MNATPEQTPSQLAASIQLSTLQFVKKLLDAVDIEAVVKGQKATGELHPNNCSGTAGSMGTSGGCVGTAGTYGCGGPPRED